MIYEICRREETESHRRYSGGARAGGVAFSVRRAIRACLRHRRSRRRRVFQSRPIRILRDGVLAAPDDDVAVTDAVGRRARRRRRRRLDEWAFPLAVMQLTQIAAGKPRLHRLSGGPPLVSDPAIRQQRDRQRRFRAPGNTACEATKLSFAPEIDAVSHRNEKSEFRWPRGRCGYGRFFSDGP